MDKIIKDRVASLKCDRVVDMSLYKPKNIIEQMSALKVKINALEELIETKNTTSKTVGDKLFKWERHCWSLPPRNGVKNIKPCAQYIKFSKKQTPREFKNVQLCIDET